LSDTILFSDMTQKERAKSSVETDPIAFLVRFANANLKAYREGDWLNLQDDLAAFEHRTPLLGPMKLLMAIEEHEPLGAYEPTVFLVLQEAIHDLLLRVAESTSPDTDRLVEAGALDLVQVALTIDVNRREGPVLMLAGKLMPLLFIKAGLLLATEPAALRLRCCPECESIFLRVRKQRYCCRRCVNRANMRAWLASREGRKAHRASSRRSYAKRVRRRLGANVRISTRERKKRWSDD
jgi:hypothetical protein